MKEEARSWRSSADYSTTRIVPVQVAEQVLKRLRSNKEVLDSSFLSSISLMQEYADSQSGKIKTDYTPKTDYVRKLLPFATERPLLRARLLRSLAQTPGISKDESTTLFEESINLMKDQRYEVDELWLSTTFTFARKKLEDGDQEGADDLFSKIVCYNFYEHAASPQWAYLFNLYCEARKLQIFCRRGNLEKLNRIRFQPYEVIPELRQYLEECKKEAMDSGKEPKRDK